MDKLLHKIGIVGQLGPVHVDAEQIRTNIPSQFWDLNIVTKGTFQERNREICSNFET